MIDIESLQTKWEQDSQVGDELSDESKKIPSLHSKYFKIYNEICLLKRKSESDLKLLRRQRWEYYTGKADPEVYESEPFDFKVLKPDIDRYLDSDPKIQKLQLKINYYEQLVIFLESILKQISDRQWQIRNAIEFQKLTLGYG